MLKASNVTVSYKGKRIIDDVSLTLLPGQISGILGLNGAGKTTLIKALLDLVPHNSGSISVFGYDSTKAKARANIVYVPESFSPDPKLKGTDFLKLFLLSHGIIFNDMHLKACAGICNGFLDQRISTYSKGMRQQLGLLAAFLTPAKILIFDEPFSGLDVSMRRIFENICLQEAKNGRSILYSSHLLHNVMSFCDQILVLHEGRTIFYGSPPDCHNFEDTFIQMTADGHYTPPPASQNLAKEILRQAA